MVEADLFISYLTGDELTPHFQPVVDAGTEGSIELLASSEVYDDIISALRSQRVDLGTIMSFLRDLRAIPHHTIPVTLDVAATAIDLYSKHGGSRRLHYFDSFHVATSQLERIPMLTSDKYIIEHAERFGIKAIDARSV